jgi:hypothetical protein
MERASGTVESLNNRSETRTAAGAGRFAEMLVLMRGVARRYKNLVNKLSKLEMNATFIEYEMFQLLKTLEEFADISAQDVTGCGAELRDERRHTRKPLFYLAETGAASLELKPRPDGMTDVLIDGGKQFSLPPALADLISALSVDTGVSDDALVGWKSVKEIAAWLSKQSGRPVSKRAITQNVYRLRKELFERGGVNPYLVQTNRRRGLRFALRRKTGQSSAERSRTASW